MRPSAAGDIERLVADRLRVFLADPKQVYEAIRNGIPASTARQHCVEGAAALAANWSDQPPAHTRAMLRALIARIDVQTDQLGIHLRPERLVDLLQAGDDRLPTWDDRTAGGQDGEAPLILTAQGHFRRLGLETRLMLDGLASRETKTRPDPALIHLLAKAHRLHAVVVQSDGGSLGAIAKREGLSGSYATRLLRLAYLAPDITRAILYGQQPAELTAAKLLRLSHLPLA